jgi:uncharacterized glyoxalase superfamily protein PhnB
MPHHALIPCLRYKDAPAAIAFLCDAFGFERHAVHADDENPAIIHHAQLLLDGNMIMLGSAENGSESGQLYGWKTPEEAGGITMCVCAVIDDPDAHAARAAAAGARIIRGPYDNQGYPGRAYDAFDTEGNVWNFGSYNPWAD